MKKKNKWISDLLFIVLIVLLAGVLVFLLVGYNREMKETSRTNQRIADQDAQLVIRQRGMGKEVYETLLPMVQAALPGIVCWGDESAVGNSHGALASRLESLIDSRLLDGIRKDLYNITKFFNMDELVIPVQNMGVAYEGMNEVMARAGVRQLVVAEDFTIPGNTDRVNISLTDDMGHLLSFASQRYAKFSTTTINDVEGTLYTRDGSTGIYIAFTFGRSRAGDMMPVAAGTPIQTAGATQYRSFLPVMFFAERTDVGIDAFIEDMREMVTLYGNGPHAMICTTEEGSAWDMALEKEFGARYIRNDRYASDMDENDYQWLAGEVYAILEEQDAFQPVELAVADARAAIAKVGK